MDLFQRVKQISLCISLCVLVTAASSFITFTNPDNRSDFPNREVISEAKVFHWSAAWPTDMRLEFIRYVPLSLHLQCSVDKVAELKQASFCFKNSKECITLNASRLAANTSLAGALIQLRFDPRLGINASINQLSADVQLPPLDASCRLSNRRGEVRSNRVFLLDLRRNFPKTINDIKKKVQLNPNISTTISCLKGPSMERYLNQTDQPAVPLLFVWDVCNVSSIDECLKGKRRSVLSLTSFKEWPVQIGNDGDLFFPFVPNDVIKELQNKSLLCSLGGKPVTVTQALVIQSVNITENDSATQTDESPRVREVVLFNSTGYSLRMPCRVETRMSLSNVSWQFRGQDSVSVTLQAGSSEKRVSVANDSSSLTFTGPFEKEIEGIYECVVIMGDDLDSSYKVSVKGPPRFAASMPSEKLVVRGANISAICEFEDADNVYTSLEVCGRKLDLSNWTNVERSCKEKNMSFNQVTCVGHAQPFSVRKTVILKVLPRPNITDRFPVKVCRNKCTLACGMRVHSQYENEGLKAQVRYAGAGVAAAVATVWSNWNPVGSTYQLLAADTVQRKRVKCEVRLIMTINNDVIFSDSRETSDLQLFRDDGANSWNRVATIITTAVFVVISAACVIYYIVYRWKHRMRQSA